MRQLRYAALFALTLLLLAAGAVYAFGRLRVPGAGAPSPVVATAGGAVDGPDAEAPVRPSPAEYARFAEEDRVWRERHAPLLGAADWRARGDGRRTPRQAMQDRIYEHVRAGRRADAIAELERWTRANRRDRDALLWLARLLNEDGRTKESLKRYREVIAIEEGQ